MSVGILPHVIDTRSIDEFYAAQAKQNRARAIAAARPQMDAAAQILAARVPGWAELTEAERLDVAFAIVGAVQAGF